MKSRKYLSIFIGFILLFSLVLASCQPKATEAPAAEEPAVAEEPAAEEPAVEEPAAEEKPVIIVAIDGDIDHIEPMQFRSINAYDATANLYEPLIIQKTLEKDGVVYGQDEFEGAGAESYEISEDGTVYTFYLREDAKFADGTAITAHDYKYTFDRAINGPGYIGLLTAFLAIDSSDQVQALDDYTLQITTNEPAALAEPIISFQVVGAISQATAEEHATDDDPWGESFFRTDSNSSGPYIVTSWKPGEEYVFEPNPNYWRGEDWFGNSKIILRVVPDAATREQLLLTGDVDIALGVPMEDVATLEENPDITVYSIPTTRVYHAGMNTTQPPFDDVRVRKALSMVVPYEAIIDNVIYGHGQNPKSPIGEGMFTHTDEYWTFDEADVEGAKALLADAGYPDGFEIELTVPQEDQARVDSATWIQAGLAEIGVDVKINALPTAQFTEILNTHELPFYIFEWYSWGNDPAFQFTWNFRCEQWTNYVMYCNEELDEYIKQLTVTRDPDARMEISHKAQQLVLDEALWIYLYQPDLVIATRSNVSGLALFNDLTLRFPYLTKN